MKKIILAGISLFLFSLPVFASDLKEVYLRGEWKKSGYFCRLSDGKFTQIVTKSIARYALKFKDGNKVMTISKFLGCEMINIGTYSVEGARLTILLESIDMHAIHPKYDCEVVSGGEVISYDEFILRAGSLYLKDSDPNDFLSWQCPSGTVFQRLIREKTI